MVYDMHSKLFSVIPVTLNSFEIFTTLTNLFFDTEYKIQQCNTVIGTALH